MGREDLTRKRVFEQKPEGGERLSLMCIFWRKHLSRQRFPNIEVTVFCSMSFFYLSQNKWLWELLPEQKYLMSIFARKLCRVENGATRKGADWPFYREVWPWHTQRRLKRVTSWEGPGRGHEATALIITRNQAIERHMDEK